MAGILWTTRGARGDDGALARAFFGANARIMTTVIMPKMGDGMEEGTLLEWLKKDGEKVKTGEVIGTIQTDKATLELESPGSGVLAGILLHPGETVPVGKPIAAILKGGETLPGNWATGGAEAGLESAPAAEATNGHSAVVAEPVAAAVGAGNDRVKASPLARKIAASAGIDLASIAGSGPGGRIVEKDVRDRVGSAPAPAAAPVPAAKSQAAVSVPSPAATAADTAVPLNRLRQVIAQRTAQSKQQVPHFYVTVEVDLERIMQLRAMFEAEGSGKVSVNDFVVKACALALQEMPEVNAVFEGTQVTRYGAVHVGIAAAVDDGLLVPVIKNAHGLSLRQLSAESKRLVARAREGTLGLDEMSGSTFSISNMGMLNVENFIAIINQPNAAIVAISSARRVPVVAEDDELEIRWRMNVTGSFDHRVVDGAVGAKFLNVVRDLLENPTRLLG